jgi:hypothetical protein
MLENQVISMKIKIVIVVMLSKEEIQANLLKNMKKEINFMEPTIRKLQNHQYLCINKIIRFNKEYLIIKEESFINN